MRRVRPLLAVEVDFAVVPAHAFSARRWRPPVAVILRTEALHRRPRLDQGAVDREVLRRKGPLHLRPIEDGGELRDGDITVEQAFAFLREVRRIPDAIVVRRARRTSGTTGRSRTTRPEAVPSRSRRTVAAARPEAVATVGSRVGAFRASNHSILTRMRNHTNTRMEGVFLRSLPSRESRPWHQHLVGTGPEPREPSKVAAIVTVPSRWRTRSRTCCRLPSSATAAHEKPSGQKAGVQITRATFRAYNPNDKAPPSGSSRGVASPAKISCS